MNISIIGAGNGGQTMAGHFAMLGHKVNLYNRTHSKLAPIQAQQSIILNEAIRGVGYLHRVTSNLAEAIEGAELIMVTTTADAHRELAEKMAPYLNNEQIVVLNPGRTLGAVEFASTVKKLTAKRVYIAEAQSLIYACRAELPGQVRVIGVKDKVLLAAWPNSDTDHVLKVVNSGYPCFVKAGSVLETSLENIGAMLHPSVILFNAATIERGQGFYFYNDMTPAVAGFLEQIDRERLMIGEAFGLKLTSVSDWVSYAYAGIEGHDLCARIKNNPAYYKILSPKSLHSRLLLEDIPTGILPLIELGRLAGVKTPLMESVLHISQALLKTDFRQSGRTLQNLGIDQLTMNQFIQQL
jgi:opine dehydrogenase